MKNIILILNIICFAYLGYSQDPALNGATFEESPIPVGSTTNLIIDGTNAAFAPINGTQPLQGFKLNVNLAATDDYLLHPQGPESVTVTDSDPNLWHVTYVNNESTNFHDALIIELIGDLPALEAWQFTINVIGAQESNDASDITQVNIDLSSDPITAGTDNPNNNSEQSALLLPVTLLSFTAESQGLDGELSWVTASETDNDRFEVERSMDGKRFVKIGEVKGNGTTTSKQSYNYTDKGVGSQVNGRVYYRLNQVDYDGSSEASEVRYISFGKGGMSVYPNPTTGNLRIEVPVSTSIVKVYNSVGELVKQANHNSDDAFELSELVDGVYNIRVEDEQGEVIGTERIVKIK